MSSGGSILDSLRSFFSSSGGGREAEEPEQDPVEARMERVEQIASGVRMAAAALPDERRELSREAEEAADAVLEAARSRAAEGRAEAAREGGDAPAGGASTDGRRRLERLARCTEVLEELHYRLLRCEVHPEVRTDEERDRAADRARESVERAADLAGSLTDTAAA